MAQEVIKQITLQIRQETAALSNPTNDNNVHLASQDQKIDKGAVEAGNENVR